MQQSKFDAIVNKLMDDTHATSKGFVLDLAAATNRDHLQALRKTAQTMGLDASQEDALLANIRALEADMHTSIEVKQSVPPPDEYVGKASLRQHVLLDTDSFVRYCQRYGNPKDSLVTYSMERVVLALSEVIDRGEREGAALPFTRSEPFSNFSLNMGKPLIHKKLWTFIESQAIYLDDPSILLAMREFRLYQEVNQDSVMEEGARQVGIIVKTRQGSEAKALFPKTFKITVPILAQDELDEELFQTIEVHLRIDLPTVAQEPAAFVLTAPTLRSIEQKRIQSEAATIVERLEGWTVLFGTTAYAKPRVGQNAWGVELSKD